ncbi:NAD-dependent dehydratase, partial [Arthrobacter deserti]|nr:NAD-dependent dehydratase [Arthrobacter deserti]
LFRPSPVMGELEYLDGASFETVLEGDDWTETATAGNRSITMTWRGLGEPFAVDVPGPESGTGLHEMFAVFRIARGGEVAVDGRRLPGSTVERNFLNGRGQSAGMAISETWVEDR